MLLDFWRRPVRLALLTVTVFACAVAFADEAAIRKNLSERLPQLPKIDEVRQTPLPGLFEVRIGSDLFYTDAQGNHLIQGALFDTRARINLTEQRIEQLTAFDFARLPLQDAITIQQGNGQRKLAVFADPHCGYCKQLERDLAGLDNVTIHTFVYPILGPESLATARAIWCAKAPQKAWRAWMLNGTPPPAAEANCDAAALERVVALGQKHKVRGTPALVFGDGGRSRGALPAAAIEKQLQASTQHADTP